ncbi:MAG: hypothetical protein WDN28_32405 [Chthoniobacter sp.]
MGGSWNDTVINPPAKRDWVDLLTGNKFTGGVPWRMADILRSLPLAVLRAAT